MNDEQQQAQRGGPAGEAAQFREAHYRGRDQPWSGDPNAFLVDADASLRSTSRPPPCDGPPSARPMPGLAAASPLSGTLWSPPSTCTRRSASRARVLEAAARAVVPGGGLPLVEHALIAPWSWNQDRSTPSPTPEGALAPLEPALAQRQIERLAAPECQATGAGDRVATVRDHVIAIGRRAL